MITARSLSVVTPTAITDAMLVSSSIAETDYAVYAGGTTYASGDRVIVTTAGVHKVYESLQGSNLGHDPTLAASAAWWVQVSATNRWAMFDLSSGSISSAASSIDVEIAPGVIDALALVDVQASSARVRMSDALHGTFFDRTDTLVTRDVRSYTDWFFAPFRQRRTLYLADLPRVSSAVVRVTLTGGAVELGTLLVGRSTVLGDVLVEARVHVIDYSRKDVDAFGQATLIERPSARQMDLNVVVPSARFDDVVDVLDERRNQVSFWAVGGANGYRSLQILGWPEFDASVRGTNLSTIAGQIKGIT